MRDDTGAPTQPLHEPMRMGSCVVSFAPHHIDGVGPRVFVVFDDRTVHESLNLSADDARRLADHLKIAACEADSIARRRARTPVPK